MIKLINPLLNAINNKVLLIVLLIAAQSALAHDGHHTNQAWQACEAKSIGESCAYVMQTDQYYKGSCRQMTTALMCVRNQPIVTLSEAALKEHIKETTEKAESKK